jgi:4-amino-4-deoxy-L-arabinose transferase-like glycosyltransferase
VSAGDGSGAARREWLTGAALPAAGIFGLAFVVRLVYLRDIADVPFVVHPIVDALAYHEWALRIAGGNWWGDAAFYQAPAYPYFLAVVYSLFGPELTAAHVVQMAMGSLSWGGGFGSTPNQLRGAPGVLAGVIMALYAPAIFFDGVVGKQSLGMLLMSLLLLLLVRFQQQPRAALLGWAGVVLGLLALTRENALVLLGAIPVWLWLRFRESAQPERTRWLAVFALGALLVLLPVGLRNYLVGDTFALTTSQLGTNFYYGNHSGASGSYVPLLPGRSTPEYESRDAKRLAEDALGRELSAGEVSDYWLGRGLAFVRARPGDWLALNVRKVLMVWNEFEIADVEDVYVYAEFSPLLRGLLFFAHFGVLAPLAAVGAVLVWGQRKNAALLYWLALVLTGGVAIFLVLARFRYPLVPLLAPLAGAGLARGATLVRERRFSELVPAAAVAAIVVALVHLPLMDEQKLRAAAYHNLAGISLRERDLEAAEAYFLKAQAHYSADPDLQLGLAVLRLRQSRLDEAEEHAREVIELAPEDHRGHRVLGTILLRQGRLEEAQVQRQMSRRLDPDYVPPGAEAPE